AALTPGDGAGSRGELCPQALELLPLGKVKALPHAYEAWTSFSMPGTRSVEMEKLHAAARHVRKQRLLALSYPESCGGYKSDYAKPLIPSLAKLVQHRKRTKVRESAHLLSRRSKIELFSARYWIFCKMPPN